MVISGDTDFKALRDYWQERSGTKHRVFLCESIEQGISATGENSARANLIRAQRKTLDIDQFYVVYQEDLQIRQMLHEAFKGTAYADRLEEIQDTLHTGASSKVIYLDALRRFGRKDGLEIYRKLKTCNSQQ